MTQLAANANVATRSRLARMRVENIGCIGPEGVTIELDDIVCLVGANNSGKSTMLKAYEAAVTLRAFDADEIHSKAGEKPSVVELWVHIPEGTGNIADKWLDTTGSERFVRSRWVWAGAGTKPVRTTWDPAEQEYAEDGKAAGLDTVFNSRLPQPFRIGSLQDPVAEHKQLMKLVLEPVVTQLNQLMDDEASELRVKIEALREEAEQPVAKFREQINQVAEKVNSSYQQVFTAGSIMIDVKLGELGIDPKGALESASSVVVRDSDDADDAKWSQQGTGSQRALFWSMLQVRSGLAQLAEQRKRQQKERVDLQKKLDKAKKRLTELTKQSAIDNKLVEIEGLQKAIDENIAANEDGVTQHQDGVMLPGYMLLIDEPETALHPSAVRAAKHHLYELAQTNGWQVMLSTHHPAFVDPMEDHTTIVRMHRDGTASPNIYRSDLADFTEDDKTNLKSLLAFDVSVAEIFFSKHVIIVEGDTEYAAFTEVMRLHPAEYPVSDRPLILRARGKANIQLLLRILKQFKVSCSVLHDIDAPRITKGTKRNSAYSMNKGICDLIHAAREAGCLITHRCSCPEFERHHGLENPDSDKPYHIWTSVRENEQILLSVRATLDELNVLPVAELSDADGGNYDEMLRAWVNQHGIDEPRFKFDDEVEAKTA